MWDLVPWLLAMMVLVACSAFFSASEAALFSLRAGDRRSMKEGAAGERLAISLLGRPDYLLSAVLFWNLVINITFFAIASIVALRIEDVGPSASAAFAVGSLMVLIFFSEMLPKSIALMRARWLASIISLPLSLAVRVVEPVIPAMRGVMVVSQRLFWPNLRRESYMQPDDLQQAIEISSNSSKRVDSEQAVLTNIVALSDIRVDEWMVPRSQFYSFRPPVALLDLKGRLPRGSYLLITEQNSDEIESSLHLNSLWDIRDDHLEYIAEPVLFVPWCATVADTLEDMRKRDREVAAIINEFGETIGILTFEDVLDTLFNFEPSRSKLILNQNPVHQIDRQRWLVSGMTSLKRLSVELNLELPKTHHITVCGIIQDRLQRLAQVGDECDWGPIQFRVLEMPHRGHLLVEVTIRQSKEASN